MNSWRRVAEGHAALGRIAPHGDPLTAAGAMLAGVHGHGLQRAGETPQFVRLEAFCREHDWQLGIARYAPCTCDGRTLPLGVGYSAIVEHAEHAPTCTAHRPALVVEVRTPLGLLCCAAYVATVEHAAGVLLPHLRELARRLEDDR